MPCLRARTVFPRHRANAPSDRAARAGRRIGRSGKGVVSLVLFQAQLAADSADQSSQLIITISKGRRYTPDRSRPCGIALPPRNDVDMELRHHIAEGGDIELVAWRDVLQCMRDRGDLS